MRFSTAIEFMKNGYFVADDAMKKMGSAIGLVEVPDIDNTVLVMKDASGMETFTLDSSMLFDAREWYVAIESEHENTYNYCKVEDEYEYIYDYYKMDDSARTIDFDTFDEAIENKERECRCGNDCNCTASEEKEETKEDSRKRLLELQKEFLTKTTQLIYESDLVEKMHLYNELADITSEIKELEKEVH